MSKEPWNKHTPGDPMPCKCEESLVETEIREGSKKIRSAENWNWARIERNPTAEIVRWRFIERKGEDVIQRCATPQPAPVMQYYYKKNACPAEDSRAETCICWHDEGKGPFPNLKNGDALPMVYGGAIGLTWRVAPQPALTDPYEALEWDDDGIATVVLKEPGRPEWVRDDDLVRFGRSARFTEAFVWKGPWNTQLSFQIKRRPPLTPAVPQVLEMLADADDAEAAAIRRAARRANIEVPE